MRYASTEKLIASVRRRLSSDPGAFSPTHEEAVEKAIRAYMNRQPTSPRLVSRQTAAKMIGVQSAHLGRLDGRLPPKIEIEGGRYAYEKSGIEQVGRELAAERKQKKASRKEKSS